MSYLRHVLLPLIIAGFLVATATVQADELTLAGHVAAMAAKAHEAAEAAEDGETAAARAAYEAIHDYWESFEDGVREADAAAYVELETKLSAVKKLVKPEAPDMAALEAAYAALETSSRAVAAKLGGGTAAAPADNATQFQTLAKMAHEGREYAEAGEAANAAHEYDEIHELWEAFEDGVREADAAVYVAFEGALSAVKKQVRADAPDLAAVATAFTALEAAAGEAARKFAAPAAAPATDAPAGEKPAAGDDQQGSVLPAPGAATQLRALAGEAHDAAEAVEHGADATAAAALYDTLHDHWEVFEDAVRDADAGGYVDLENALHTARDLTKATPWDAAAGEAAFRELERVAREVADGLDDDDRVVAAPSGDLTMQAFVDHLGAAGQSLASGDTSAASSWLDRAVQVWPTIEGHVATRDGDAYGSIESDLGKARAALRATPADTATATAAVDRLIATATPFLDEHVYTVFDAASVMLREGLEALLVLVALLAFVKKTGNASKQGWIWGGAGVGLLASVAAGFVLQYVFSQATAGGNRELVEGITGLVAAGMLFWVSYWLHSKSSLHSWQKYINSKTAAVLQRGSLMGLATLAFLAVFREGAETVVFYLGMAPSIAFQDLLIGFAVASAILVVVAVLMIGLGLKLPMHKFFFVAGLLVYYLGFKFVGHGIHALQVADVIPPLGVPTLPTIPALGIYPTWAAIIPQAIILAAALAVIIYFHNSNRHALAVAGRSPRPA